MKAKQKEEYTMEEHDLTTRERLIHAAAELFCQKGYAATTVREIVAAAGVSKPVLYYYFESKEGIFHDIVRFGLDKVENQIREIRMMECSIAQKIRLLFTNTIEMIQKDLQIIRLLYSVQYCGCQETPSVNLQDIQDRFDSSVLELVKEGILQGEFVSNDPDAMRWVLVGAMSITVDMMVFRPELMGGRESLERMVDLILRGFAHVER